MKYIILILFLIFMINLRAHSAVLQEGWFQVLLGTQHVGYQVYRYEFDEKKKQFKFTSFTKTNALGGDLTDSLQAVSTQGFEPISYQYTSQVGKESKLIDAAFKNGQMTARIVEKGQTRTETLKIKKETFLSYFLVYLMLNNKSGIKKGLSFKYDAIAEEDAKVYTGFADIKDLEKINGHEVFRVTNKFKNVQAISFITPDGRMMEVRQPTIGSQLKIATQAEATKGFPSAEKSLKTLFKTIPEDSPLTKVKLDVKPTQNDTPTVEPKSLKVEESLNSTNPSVE